jgi:hypothetical protein
MMPGKTCVRSSRQRPETVSRPTFKSARFFSFLCIMPENMVIMKKTPRDKIIIVLCYYHASLFSKAL